MFRLLALLGALGALSGTAAAGCPPLLDHHVRPLAGEETVHLCEAYRDRVVLVVNTASQCGFTPQYEGLEALYDRYRDQGLVILGFPSDDFGGQEPGSEEEIEDFCRSRYGIRFPMFEKLHARGADAHPLYQGLSEVGGAPQWNFHKYLLNRNGEFVAAFASRVRPDAPELLEAIRSAL